MAGALVLDHATAQVAHRLLIEERVTLLVPVRASHPGWLAPSRPRRSCAVARRPPGTLCGLLVDAGPLYASSANRTDQPPAASTAQVREMFGATAGTLDLPDPAPGASRSATTTVRINPDCALDITRTGAQDHANGGPDNYLHLNSTYLHPLAGQAPIQPS
ncbi:MAG TPA: hypothetical protein VGX25_24665 [Actinophytocola sp.]|uniref:hypothetical protein n=1 Tax=Actinophytocola sp. TaxID=1872138 RepID=UPI002DDD1A01|nr:hypothetical protein [Actinophytocola sp.]HEV2782598.1 hypothetical protein [Actinophytocola sp.]